MSRQQVQARPRHRRWRKVALATALGPLAVGSVATSSALAAARPQAALPFKGQKLVIAADPPTSPGVKPFEEELTRVFHKVTGADLVWDYDITSTEVELETIDTMATSKSGPDLIQLGDTINAAAYASGAMATLTKADWAELGGQSAFWPGTLYNSGPDNSHDTLVPWYVDPTMMVYNKYLFNKAGIKQAPTTWTEYVQDAEKINDPSKGIYGTDWFPNDTQVYKAMWYLGTDYGGSVFDKKLTSAELDTSPWLKGLQFWFDLDTKFHVVPPSSDTNTQADFASQFASGKIGEEVAATASYEGTYEAGAIKNDFQFAPLPTTPYGEKAGSKILPKSMDLYEGMDIAKYASMPLTLAFLKLLTSSKYQELNFRLGGYMPATVAAGMAVKRLDRTLMVPQIAAEEGVAAVPFTPAWSTFQTAIGTVTIDAGSTLATSGSVSNSDLQSLLDSANSTIQQQLK